MGVKNQNILEIKKIILISSVFFAFLLLLWLHHFSKRTTMFVSKPLSLILANIELIKQGTYDLTKISNTNQEMFALCEAMEDMTKAIQREIRMTKEKADLETQLLAKENENLKKDELLALSEVKMLQNQINPHFLFNALNMTYRFALYENAIKSSEMIERISALLRYGLDMQNKTSDINSEIKAVENYIEIQKQRLGSRVEFKLMIDDTVPNIAMPGMIIQPIVENSLKHGLNNCIKDGEIIISISYHDEKIFILVSDNGDGMDTDLCEQMMLNGFKDETGEHLGLYNIAKRLEMYYQDRVDISIDSEINCGFSFHIRIEVESYE